MFQPVSSKVDFPAQEERILSFWKAGKIFEKSVAQRQGAEPFILYEGPPTANGNPGIHHVLARVFKDIMPRYKAMKGFYAPRRAGWDTHGLPVELEVEKTLGFTSKTQIEKHGVEKFNKLCRESVFTYLEKWVELTERIAFWEDMDNPYVTLKNEYIETGWWIIKNLWDKKLLYQGFRVTPHCPRCGTSLSSHEVALGYRDDADDPSVYVKFRVDWKQSKANLTEKQLKDLCVPVINYDPNTPTYLLAWTTTPWTLTGNAALAVAPNAEYLLYEVTYEDNAKEYLIFAYELQSLVLNPAVRKSLIKDVKEYFPAPQRFPGSKLVGLSYERLYEPQPISYVMGWAETYMEPPISSTKVIDIPARNRVVSADFVSMTDGTGIVHIAPAFGADDFELGKSKGLPVIQTVDLAGKMLPLEGLHPWDGKFVKEADKEIIKDLRTRNLLFRSERIKHTYPFCWRCSSPLLYYAKPSWYIRTSAKKQDLIDGNQKINWYPEHIKEGRFGDWLRNNVDWALSRERYWGTPLPVWRCQNQTCHHEECIGSREEIKTKPGLQGWQEALDLHRPYIDQVTFSCPKCGGVMRRVPEVLDCWFDSGAMPFAQWHYPLFKSDVNERYQIKDMEGFNQWFPADYICEAVDQTRGWFYTLHALSTLVKGEPCFKNVICLGLILDAKGEKMSKAKGNVVDPWKVIKERGADALRWYMLTASPPGNVRRFDTNQVTEVQRQFLLTLWNTYSFFITYALIDKYNPATASVPEPKERPELDRWILSELNSLIQQVVERLDNYDPTTAGRAIADFVDNLSNWYVRRSRRRFWKSENDEDKLAAYATLYDCLVTLCKLLAPFTPFMAEEMYWNLVRSVYPEQVESVHMADYPVVDAAEIDQKLSLKMGVVRDTVSLARSARESAQIKVRQPIQAVRVWVDNVAKKGFLEQSRDLVREEVNTENLTAWDLGNETERNALAEYVSFNNKLNLKICGLRLREKAPIFQQALEKMDAFKTAFDVINGNEIVINGERFSPSEILTEVIGKKGYTAKASGKHIVVIDETITPELKAEGLAREIVHRIQTMRRSAGFDIADYIVTYYDGQEAIEQIMQDPVLAAYIRQETLSREIRRDIPPDAYIEKHKLDGLEITLGVKKLS